PETNLGQLGFGIAAASFAAFTALALTRRADRPAARLFLGVLAAQAIWAFTMAIGAGDRPLASLAAPSLESLRVLAWTVFLLALGRREPGSGRLHAGLLATATGLALMPVAASWNDWPGWTQHGTRIASLALALLIAERLYR